MIEKSKNESFKSHLQKKKKTFCKSQLKQKIEMQKKQNWALVKHIFLSADVFEKKFFRSHLCKRRLQIYEQKNWNENAIKHIGDLVFDF